MSLKIDLHTHILPEKLPDLEKRYGYGGFTSIEHYAPCCARLFKNGEFFREIDDRCWSPLRRLEDCDHDGVGVQALSTVPVMFSYWAEPADGHDLSRLLNDHIAGVVRDHPGRFIGLGTLPLQDPQLAIEEMERCRGELGFPGVQIGTHCGEWNLDDPALFPVFENAARTGVSMFVHPWEMLGEERMPSYFLPWLVGMPAETSLAICSLIFGGVLERLPDLKICFAHGGGSFLPTLARIEKGWIARPDLCQVNTSTSPSGYLDRFYIDSLVHDERSLLALIDQMGPNRIALGSDYPFPLGEDQPGSLIDSMKSIDDDVRERLLSGTALEFLGLEGKIVEKLGS